MEIKNAVIKSAILTTADYGQLTGSLTLEYGGGSFQGFGTYTLYNPHYPEDKNFGGFFIFRCLETVGVSEWSRLVGEPVRARIGDDRLIKAIGHFIEDKWFCPEQEYETFK
jgi:hypothetical protein